MTSLDKRAVIQEILDEYGYDDWCIVQPSKANVSISEPKCVLANFKTKKKAELVIPDAWFRDPRRYHAIGELITLAVQNSAPFVWRSPAHRFFLFVPQGPNQDTVEAPSSLRSTPASGSTIQKILVVEDENLARKNICEFLRQEGYGVDEAADGGQAVELLTVELLNDRSFDLVISDFAMPRLDGLELVNRVHSASPHTPIIFMSAYLSMDSAKALLGEAAEFIQKPFQFDVLLSAVQRLTRATLPAS